MNQRTKGWKLTLFYAVLIAFAVVYLYPFFIQIATSFKSNASATDSPLSLIPNPLDLTTWKRIFGIGDDAPIPIMRWLTKKEMV